MVGLDSVIVGIAFAACGGRALGERPYGVDCHGEVL